MRQKSLKWMIRSLRKKPKWTLPSTYHVAPQSLAHVAHPHPLRWGQLFTLHCSFLSSLVKRTFFLFILDPLVLNLCWVQDLRVFLFILDPLDLKRKHARNQDINKSGHIQHARSEIWHSDLNSSRVAAWFSWRSCFWINDDWRELVCLQRHRVARFATPRKYIVQDGSVTCQKFSDAWRVKNSFLNKSGQNCIKNHNDVSCSRSCFYVSCSRHVFWCFTFKTWFFKVRTISNPTLLQNCQTHAPSQFERAWSTWT